VILLVAGLDIRVLSEEGQMLRHLSLDPSRDNQSQERPEVSTMSRDMTTCRRQDSGGPRASSANSSKWLAYAGAVVALGFVAIVPVEAVVGSTRADDINNFVITQSLALVPIAAGIAVLRYHLYEIDRIINRTIVYLLATGSLVAVYAGTVFVISAVAVGSSDNLTVAIATLVAAALFRPVLRRVQGLVDRRFYRRKYDAQLTIDAFGYRLREETNLDELTSDLLGVVRQTVQPAHASVWLQPSNEGPRTTPSTR
jgi:hypothetical protein